MKTFILNSTKRWLAFTLTASFLFSQSLASQNIVVEPEVNEILVLRLNEYTGTLQWQVSPDGEDWGDVPNGTADTLVASTRYNRYYRGSVKVPGCPEYYTDTVQILADTSSGGGNGTVVENEDAGSIITQIQQAKNAGLSYVRINPGTYVTQNGIAINNITNLEIDATDVTLIGKTVTRVLDMNNCSHVILRGLTIDYDPLPITQGTIVGFAVDRTWTDVRIHEGYPAPTNYTPEKIRHGFMWTYDPVTLLHKPGTHNRFVIANGITPRGDNVYRLDHGTSRFVDKAEIGDYIRIPQLYNRPGAIEINGGNDLEVVDVTLYSAPTHFAFSMLYVNNLTVRRVKLVPGPPPAGAAIPRLSSSVGDGLHFRDITGDFIVEDCVLKSTGDDAIAINDFRSWGLVFKTGEDKRLLTVGVAHSSSLLMPGSRVQFFVDGAIVEAMVVSRSSTTMSVEAMRAVRDQAVKNPRTDNDYINGFDIELDRAVDVREGSLIWLRDHNAKEFLVRGNIITNCGSRGMVVNRSFGLIENNDIEHTLLTGIHIYARFRDDTRTGSQQHLLIRNNRISRTNHSFERNNTLHVDFIGAISLVNWEGDARGFGGHQDMPYTDIFIEGNRIDKAYGANIQVHTGENITIRDNIFSQSHLQNLTSIGSRPVDNRALIFLQEVKNATVSDNMVISPGPFINFYPLSYVSVSGLEATNPFISRSEPPTVSITSPAGGAVFYAGNDITIMAEASDPEGGVTKVEFYEGTTKLGEDTLAPFSYTWESVDAGSYTLIAKAYGEDGANILSDGIRIEVHDLGGDNDLGSSGIIYKNTFAGAAGTSPAATTPEINTIAGFTHWANEAITLDGNGNIIWDGEATPNFGTYKFRLDPTAPLNQNPALSGIKATVVLRTASRWITLTYGNLQPTINPTANNANTWFLASGTALQIFGGEGTAQGGTVGSDSHAENDTITVEYIYYFDQTVTLISNGDTIVNRLSKPHTQGGAEADPSILWCMLTFQKVTGFIDDISKRPFISELTIETLSSEMTTRYIDLSVDQTGWEDCIIAVRNDFNDFSEQQIKVFPNPSDGIFEMSIAGFSSGQSLNLRVVDSLGRIIQTRDERLGGDGYHNFQIDLSGQSAGIYYIILMDGTNKVYSCKVVKNKR